MPTKKHAFALKPLLSRLVVPLIGLTSFGLIACNWVLAAPAQLSGGPSCQILDPAKLIYPPEPVSYPAQSNAYQVEYRLNGGAWLPAQVHASYYGASIASPFATYSGYSQGNTSMTAASIPTPANTHVELRVTKLGGLNLPVGQVSVRPTPKPITVERVQGKTAWLSLETPVNFQGDQFIFWYHSSDAENSALQGLAFFLEPPLTPPASGPKVRVVRNKGDMDHLAGIDTLDFEGVVGDQLPYVFDIPAHVKTVYLGDNAWLRGKIRFEQDGTGKARELYGHGVIDASRFDYSLRHCIDNPQYAEQGYKALSFGAVPAGGTADSFTFNGFTISDTNFAATDTISSSYVNDVKVMSWNGNNGGFLLGDHNLLTNVFLRDGDDSLMLWGSATSIINATIWQNYNGGVVNLGWGKESPGESDYIDGLYVVKTDWLLPNEMSWTTDFLKGHLGHQNNAIFDSLMIPGTRFGTIFPPVFSDIYIEDDPRVLFSLKIDPPHLGGKGESGGDRHPDLTLDGDMRLTIQNLSTPRSTKHNQIGFQTILTPFEDGYFELGLWPYTLHGNIDITLNGVTFRKPDGTSEVLNSGNAATTGKIQTNGNTVTINYGS